MRNTKQILNDIEAAEFLRMGVQTLRDWRIRGEGPPYLKIHRAVRYRIQDLEAYLESKLVNVKS